ncbi:MAG: dockerin type I domain-containing protein, partial [Planctomycetota bacterium]
VNGAGPENVDTGAIAYYFTRSATGRYINDNADDLDYDEVFDRIAQDTADTSNVWANAARRMNSAGIPLIAYEGNQHLDKTSSGSTNPHPNLNQVLNDLTRDPRMEVAYRNAFEAWETAGGTMPAAFVDVQRWTTGQWGHKEYYNQPNAEAPLNRALLGWVADHQNGFYLDGGETLVGGTSFDFQQDQAVTLRVSEDFGNRLTADDLTLTNLDTGATVDNAVSQLVLDTDTRSATFSFLGDELTRLPDGNYRATLPANAAVDAGGPAIARDVTLDFYILTGDLDRDRSVTLTDAARLERNFGKTDNPTFSEGDLNYDGIVNLTDAALLERNFNTTLPPAATTPPSLFADDDPPFSQGPPKTRGLRLPRIRS